MSGIAKALALMKGIIDVKYPKQNAKSANIDHTLFISIRDDAKADRKERACKQEGTTRT